MAILLLTLATILAKKIMTRVLVTRLLAYFFVSFNTPLMTSMFSWSFFLPKESYYPLSKSRLKRKIMSGKLGDYK